MIRTRHAISAIFEVESVDVDEAVEKLLDVLDEAQICSHSVELVHMQATEEFE